MLNRQTPRESSNSIAPLVFALKVLTSSVNRENFLQGLSRVQNSVERKNTVPILSNVLIDGTGETLRMLATDMEVGISGNVDASIKSKGIASLFASTVPWVTSPAKT